MQDMFTDLNAWEDEMKLKDRKLIDGEEADDSTGFFDLLDDGEDHLKDVNSTVMSEEELKDHAKYISEKFVSDNREALAAKAMQEAEEKQARIKPKTYQEYNKWDAFDVDEQLKILDAKEREEKAKADKEKALQE